MENSRTKIYGFPLWMMLLFGVIAFVAMYVGGLGGDMISTMAFTLVLGLILNWIGDQIPWVNKNLGAGMLLCMFVPSFLVYEGIITENVVTNANAFFSTGGVGYMTFFIVILMANSMLNIDRKVLLKCISRFIPLLLITVLGTIIIMIPIGSLFGINIVETITEFVFPIMGSGTSGAAALSQIYTTAGGADPDAYYSTAVVYVVLSATLCIFFAVGLNLIGSIFPKLTGDKSTLMKKSASGSELGDEDQIKLPKAELSDVVSGLVLAGIIYVAAGIIAAVIPPIGGITLHQYAYMVIILIIVNYADIVPLNIRSGLKTLSTFCVNLLLPMICVCIGITLMSWESFLTAFVPTTLIMCVITIAVACLIAAIFGNLFGMYPIDAAVTAALCQADMGGGSDISILTPAGRMGLIAYATVASRIGYAIILILASIIFPILI